MLRIYLRSTPYCGVLRIKLRSAPPPSATSEKSGRFSNGKARTPVELDTEYGEHYALVFYSVILDAFFSDNSTTRAECDRFAETHFGGPVKPVELQGAFS